MVTLFVSADKRTIIQVPADTQFPVSAAELNGCYERDLCGCREVICFDSVSYDGKECRVEVITLACCQ